MRGRKSLVFLLKSCFQRHFGKSSSGPLTSNLIGNSNSIGYQHTFLQAGVPFLSVFGFLFDVRCFFSCT
jgi:hypothetical protein